MRAPLGILLLALSSCAAPAPPEAPTAPLFPPPLPPSPVAEARAPAPPKAEAEIPEDPAPKTPSGPLLEIGETSITVEGTALASVPELERASQIPKIDGVFNFMKEHRESWKMARPYEPFPGEASLLVAPGTSGRLLAATVTSIAFAGYEHIHVAVKGRYHHVLMQIPKVPCSGGQGPCSPEPKHVLHVEAAAGGFRWRMPAEDPPIDGTLEGERATIEGFRTKASELVASAKVDALVLHFARDEPFSKLGPFLVEVEALGRKAKIARDTTLALRRIDELVNVERAEPTPSSSLAVLGPLPPKAVQKVLTASDAKLRACYAKVAARTPNAEGEARTKLNVDTKGAVTSVVTTVSGDLPKEMITCLQPIFRTLKLPSPLIEVIVVYTMSFPD